MPYKIKKPKYKQIRNDKENLLYAKKDTTLSIDKLYKSFRTKDRLYSVSIFKEGKLDKKYFKNKQEAEKFAKKYMEKK